MFSAGMVKKTMTAIPLDPQCDDDARCNASLDHHVYRAQFQEMHDIMRLLITICNVLALDLTRDYVTNRHVSPACRSEIGCSFCCDKRTDLVMMGC
ncbi:hypothetical protein R1flu_029287 [Riccia fluitans]|uniref:Uncharacterized protein n=1 Tax=Riccia fluitans TaxID=41844 RepID=A0ABD1XP51_9MARC